MSLPADNILVTATHGVILLGTIATVVSSLLNRKTLGKQSEKLGEQSDKLDQIEIRVNGGLAEAVRAAVNAAIKEARDAP